MSLTRDEWGGGGWVHRPSITILRAVTHRDVHPGVEVTWDPGR